MYFIRVNIIKSHRHINSLSIENRHVCQRKVANYVRPKEITSHKLPPNLNQYLDESTVALTWVRIDFILCNKYRVNRSSQNWN